MTRTPIRHILAVATAPLWLLTACGGESDDTADNSADSTATTAATATTSAGTRATTTTDATTTTAAAGAGTSGPVSTNWQSVGLGDCLATLPTGEVSRVDVIDCAQPHAAEFVGRTGPGGDPLRGGGSEPNCAGEFTRYSGAAIDASVWSVAWLKTTSTVGAGRTVLCFVTPKDGAPVTGSVRKAG